MIPVELGRINPDTTAVQDEAGHEYEHNWSKYIYRIGLPVARLFMEGKINTVSYYVGHARMFSHRRSHVDFFKIAMTGCVFSHSKLWGCIRH